MAKVFQYPLISFMYHRLNIGKAVRQYYLTALKM